ncbi:hypothetical protein [Neptunicella marina]|uniref:Glycosyltransferase subfamily 4-like N-terminal domain-containing protein n=1 Tax=Neptunicella marina TaxID=2125989 RepID=A0A8J6IT09_9ALTE|nr:hypothetical protein [Neptunicella marina]MBC3765764.1 hypothetical protein [Neptunicella marina]
MRILKFAKYLPDYQVRPVVLTINPDAYEHVDAANEALIKQLQQDIPIVRTKGWDARKLLSYKGKYFSACAIPDPWASWIPGTIIKAVRLVKRYSIQCIWATYPIVSSLVVGYMASRITHKPLLVDLRDPVWEEETWDNSLKLKIVRWIEKKVLSHAATIIFTSPGTIEKYQRRYPENLHHKFHLIENGFDEDDFSDLPVLEKDKRKVFLHSGLLPVYERNPQYFFEALSQLKQQGLISADDVLFRFRATGSDQQYQQQILRLNLEDLVEIVERKDYRYALAEMQSADVLMIFQHRTCDWQIPAKLFEYFRVAKPILLLAGKSSDTASITQQSGRIFARAEIDDVEQIKQAILAMLKEQPLSIQNDLSRYSRREGAKKLAKLFNSI